MRIAQVSTPHESTPPERYGGIERVVSLITEKLVERGHDVTLFATRNSKTKAKLHSFFPRPVRPYDFKLELLQASEVIKHADEFDIIHNHADGVIPFLQFADCPSLTTLHNPLANVTLPYFIYYKNANYAAVSSYQSRKIEYLPHVWVVHNSLNTEEFPFSDQKENFLLFVGYFAPYKGMDIAIEVAKRLNQKLVIIAKLDDSAWAQEYYKTKIAPHIDGEQICYLGEMGEERKEFFRKAKCLLCPIQGYEPFGLVMIEAMACGTPVVAFNRASVPEIVRSGVTGFVVEDVESMVEAVKQIDTINPQACREHVIRNFSVDLMTDRYLSIYQQAINSFSSKQRF